MRTITAVTTSRADYGIYRSILAALCSDPDIRVNLLVSGMHLSPEFGLSVGEVEADGYEITEQIEMLLSSDSPQGIAKSMATGVAGFAQAFARQRPDLLVVLGDRFEMHAAALAALPFKIPVAHIHGGEVTRGAMDDALRHCMTKLCHLHFAATEEYARRIRQLGEEPWRVVVSGAPALDLLDEWEPMTPEQLATDLGFPIAPETVLVTYHPVTLQYEEAERHGRELLAALESCGRPALFTLPNADTGGRVLGRLARDYVAAHSESHLIENLGTRRYFSMLGHVAAMVGNSSSGLIEAPSFELPVVNIGRRQEGRVRAANVIDVAEDRASITAGLRRALDPAFRARLRGLRNPYRQPAPAAIVIRDKLRSVALNDELVMKRFCDLPVAQTTA